jgi:hypothetical protein
MFLVHVNTCFKYVRGAKGYVFSIYIWFQVVHIYIYIFVIQLIIFQQLFKLRSKIKFENHINNDELLKNHMREIKGEGGRGILLN